MEVEQLQSDPWTLYLYAMKSPVTRDKYQKRLGKFLDFLGLEGATIQEKSITFVEMAKKDSNWTFNSILRFVQFQNNRVLKKEITSATVRNYVKSIKLLCEMADLPIAWKKITRGFSKGRRYADDRIPSIEEIKKLIGYPDRRIKAIVYTMASSRIRLGAWDYLHWGDIPDPAVFPEKLPLRCIKLHGVKPDMIVYDPFMGIGTTALASISLGVNYLGTEIDSEYVKVALEDIEKRRRKE